MKKIKKGTVGYLILFIIATAIFGMILYPLFDFLYYKFITNSEFVYSYNKHIIQPLIFAVFFGITFWLVDRKRK